MSNISISIVIGLAILAAAIPYVTRIRHPQQKPLAAYFIFISVFAASAFILFNLLLGVANVFGLEDRLDDTGPMLLFLVLMLLPALILARWLARKPPWRRGPPP